MADDKKLDPAAERRKRYELGVSAIAKQYKSSTDDIEFAFVPGKQWDDAFKQLRDGRPTYEFNKTRPVVKSVTNDMRQNRPQIKIRAAEDGKKPLADILQGLIRNIEAQSRADTAYDTAGFYAAAGGYGVFEIATEYCNDDVFEQDIRIKEKRDPFAIVFDPAAKEFDKRDARWAFETLTFTREAFKARWPDADPVDFTPTNLDAVGTLWASEKTVTVVKYWCKHAKTKTIYQLSDGRVLDEDDYKAIEPTLNQPPQADPMTGQPQGEPLTLKAQRDVQYDQVTCEYASGVETLDGPFDWAGKFIPLVPVWGESLNINGEETFQGLVRPLKDSQRVFNWSASVGYETMANQPRAPFLVTPKMIEGYENQWKTLATKNAPALIYNVDNEAPGGGMPQRAQPPAFPAGFFDSAQFAADLIKSVANVVDAPIQSRASSGKAIQAVEHQQDVGNFDYVDNLARAVSYCGEILVDLIPKIYDTEREVMVLGEDGKESYTQLNQSVQNPQTGEWQVINDLSQGKYAVTVTVGPSYATQRMETLDVLTQMAQNPQLAPMVSDLIVKNMDFKGSEELEKRLRKVGIMQGFIEPGEGDPQPPPQQPDPAAQAEAALKAAQAQLAAANAAKSEAETAETQVDTAIKVQHAPMLAMDQAAKTDAQVSQSYAQHPLTPYWGPPQPEQPQEGP